MFCLVNLNKCSQYYCRVQNDTIVKRSIIYIRIGHYGEHLLFQPHVHFRGVSFRNRPANTFHLTNVGQRNRHPGSKEDKRPSTSRHQPSHCAMGNAPRTHHVRLYTTLTGEPSELCVVPERRHMCTLGNQTHFRSETDREETHLLRGFMALS